MKEIKFFCFLLASLLVVYIFKPTVCVSAGKEPAVFSTWEGFEVDKCASIWLIKRFIDENAIIKFFPKGDVIKEGIPFDTPEAKFRRYFNMSTYESLLLHYNIKDSRAIYIGRIIHDVEVNLWEKKVMKETVTVLNTVNCIISESKDEEEVIERCNGFFDSIYEERQSPKF